MSHAERVEQVLAALGRHQQLPPTHDIRELLAQMRNLLAEHRDERVLYRRLTREHWRLGGHPVWAVTSAPDAGAELPFAGAQVDHLAGSQDQLPRRG